MGGGRAPGGVSFDCVVNLLRRLCSPDMCQLQLNNPQFEAGLGLTRNQTLRGSTYQLRSSIRYRDLCKTKHFRQGYPELCETKNLCPGEPISSPPIYSSHSEPTEPSDSVSIDT